MKTLFIALISLFSISILYSQIPGSPQIVNDPGANAKLVESLSAAQEQINNLNNIKEELQEAQDALQTVSNAVQHVSAIEDIQDNVTKIYNNGLNTLTELQNTGLLTADESSDLFESINSIFDKSTELLTLTEKILTDGLFNMSDFERLQYLDDINEKLEKSNGQINNKKFIYSNIASRRQVFSNQ